MESINIEIEPCKTYFSDGCVESARSYETELLREDLKTDSDEPVSILMQKDVIIIFLLYLLIILCPQNNWSSWLFNQSAEIGASALNTVDYLGESLANFFGITTPKYQFEINYHNSLMQEVSFKNLYISMKND